MRHADIDAPWIPPIRLYLDIASFHPDIKNKGLWVPPWVNRTLALLATDFQFFGLHESKIIKKKFELVSDVLYLDIIQWKDILEMEQSILFYYAKPSNAKIVQYISYTRLFPFTGDAGYIRGIVKQYCTQNTKASIPAKIAGFRHKAIKHIKDLFQ